VFCKESIPSKTVRERMLRTNQITDSNLKVFVLTAKRQINVKENRKSNQE
jgi:hypothetical protein